MAPWTGYDKRFQNTVHSLAYIPHMHTLMIIKLKFLIHISHIISTFRSNFQARNHPKNTSPAGVAIYNGDARVQGCIKDSNKLRMAARHMIDPLFERYLTYDEA